MDNKSLCLGVKNDCVYGDFAALLCLVKCIAVLVFEWN